MLANFWNIYSYAMYKKSIKFLIRTKLKSYGIPSFYIHIEKQ